MTLQRMPQRGRGRLEKFANEREVKILDLVKEAIRAEGSIFAAANRLQVAPNTIRYHLQKAGLKIRVHMTVEFIPLGEGDKSEMNKSQHKSKTGEDK